MKQNVTAKVKICHILLLVVPSIWFYTPLSIAETDKPIQVHRNLWDHLEHVSVPVKQVSGLAWADGSLWVLDVQRKRVCPIDRANNEVESLNFPAQSSPHSLVYDGKAFWTWDSESKSFRSLTPDGKKNTIDWQGGVGKALGFYDGKLLFVSADKTKIQCLDIVTKIPSTLDAPCKGIKDFAWDGRYLWCLATAAGELYSAKLIGYDIGRQMAFTYIPFSKGYDYVTFGSDRFWMAPQSSSQQDNLNVMSFPMPKNGDVCFGPSRRYNRIVTGTVKNPNTKFPKRDVTVVFKKVPLDDYHIKVEDISFDPPYTEVFGYQDVFRWLVFTGITIPAEGSQSIQGTIKYSIRECHHIIIPDNLPENGAIPADVADEYLRITEDMKHPSVAAASRKTGAEGEVNPYWKMRKIHDWILDTMRVDKLPGTKPLSYILQCKHGECDEYKALMTALCRLNGIPCRNHGAARPPDIGHAWNSVYLPGGIGWIEIDLQLNDIRSKKSGQLSHYMIWSQGVQRNAISSRIPGRDIPTITVRGVERKFDFDNYAFGKNGMPLPAKFVFENQLYR